MEQPEFTPVTEEILQLPPEWLLEDDNPRTVLDNRLCEKLGWGLEAHADCRIPGWMKEKIKSFVAANHSVFSNDSVFYRDAIWSHYRMWSKMTDVASTGPLRTQKFLDDEKVKWARREVLLEHAAARLEQYKKWDDANGLANFCDEMQVHFFDERIDGAPQKYLSEIRTLIATAQEYLKRIP